MWYASFLAIVALESDNHGNIYYELLLETCLRKCCSRCWCTWMHPRPQPYAKMTVSWWPMQLLHPPHADTQCCKHSRFRFCRHWESARQSEHKLSLLVSELQALSIVSVYKVLKRNSLESKVKNGSFHWERACLRHIHGPQASSHLSYHWPQAPVLTSQYLIIWWGPISGSK